MRYAIGLLALCVAGCGPSIDATEAGGVATWRGPSPGDAVAAANAHCSKYGRTARVNQVDGLGYLAFSCEKTGS